MEKNKRLIELLTLVKDTIYYGYDGYESGICSVLDFLYFNKEISLTDFALLTDCIQENRPTRDNQYSEFRNIIL